MKVYEYPGNVSSLLRCMHPVRCVTCGKLFPTLTMAAEVTNVSVYSLTRALRLGDGHLCGKQYENVSVDDYFKELADQKKLTSETVVPKQRTYEIPKKKVGYFKSDLYGVSVVTSEEDFGMTAVAIGLDSRVDLAARASKGQGIVEMVFDVHHLPTAEEFVSQICDCYKAITHCLQIKGNDEG